MPDNGGLADENARLRAELARLRAHQSVGLVWEPQPEEPIQTALRTRTPILTPHPTLNVPGAHPNPNRPHLLIEGDNLHTLTLLQDTHANTVDVIYIDPPYNTGNEFIYTDRLVTKDDTFRHSAWLSFMHARLELARTLLTPTGIIAISIDDHEQAHLRLLCDHVFGERNFIAQLIWNGGRKNDSTYFSTGHDYILIYTRDADALKAAKTQWREKKPGLNDVLTAADNAWTTSGHNPAEATRLLKTWFRNLPTSHPARANKHYDRIDENGRVYFAGSTAWPNGQGPTYEVLHPVTGQPCKQPGPGWRYSQASMQKLIEDGLIVFGPDHTTVPTRKTFLDEVDTQAPVSVFYQDRRAANKQLASMIGPKKFQFTKNTDTLAWLINLVTNSNPNATVLDFFAGSGSTGHAVALLNAADNGQRQAILATNNENNICRNVTLPRMKAALTGEWADRKPHTPLPGSLHFYTADFTDPE